MLKSCVILGFFTVDVNRFSRISPVMRGICTAAVWIGVTYRVAGKVYVNGERFQVFKYFSREASGSCRVGLAPPLKPAYRTKKELKNAVSLMLQGFKRGQNL